MQSKKDENWQRLFGGVSSDFWDRAPDDYVGWWKCVPDTLLPVFFKDDEFKIGKTETENQAWTRCLDNFHRVVAMGFDCPFPVLIYQVCNRDHLWVPTSGHYREAADEMFPSIPLNAWQLFNLDTTQRDPLSSMFHYLFGDEEPYHEEEYDFSEAEILERRALYDRVRRRYKSAEEYVDRVFGLLLVTGNGQYIDRETAVELVTDAVRWE